jgi:hypothetical protein
MRREAGANSQFYRMAIEYRQHARHPHAYRTDVLVGTRAEAIGASAEQLRVGQQMSVNFESDYRFVCIGSHWSNTPASTLVDDRIKKEGFHPVESNCDDDSLKANA